MDDEALMDRVRRALEIVRPYLQADGGDVELLRVTADGVVQIRLTGTCGVCPLSPMTLRAGIERALVAEVPEVKRVEAVGVR
jgi:Fe-S cluster biogenesis protein NfuA